VSILARVAPQERGADIETTDENGGIDLQVPPRIPGDSHSVQQGRSAPQTLLLVAACAVATGGIALLLAAMVRAVPLLRSHMYPDGWMLYSILRIRDGQALYTDYGQYPFILALYTPLYYTLVGMGTRFLSLDAYQALVFGRALSALATLASLWALYAIGGRLGLSRIARWVGIGVFVLSPSLHPWGYTLRPDALALALSLCGLWLGLTARKPWTLVCTALILAGAFYTKQSFVSAAVALGFAHLKRRDYPSAAIFTLSYGALVAGGCAALEISTAGLFSRNVLVSNAVTADLRYLAQLLLPALLQLPLLTLAAVGGRRHWSCHVGSEPVLIYLVCSTVVCLVALTKAGSDVNYFLEPLACLALYAGRGIQNLTVAPEGRWAQRGDSRAEARGVPASVSPGLPALLAAVVIAGAYLFWTTYGSGHIAWLYNPAPDEYVRELVEDLHDRSGQDVLLEYGALPAVLAGKTPVLADPLGIGLVAAQGRWDAAPLNRALESGTVAVVVLHEGNWGQTREVAGDGTIRTMHRGYAWWPAGIEETIRAHYRPTGAIGPYRLYQPGPPDGT